MADVSGFEPAVEKSVLSFLRTVPISFEDGRAAHQNFAILGDADFEVRQNLAHRSNAVMDGRVDGDHRGSFGEAVAFVNPNADGGEPFGKFAA